MASFDAEQIASKFASMGNLPTLPAAASEALAIANDKDCSIQDLSDVVHNDAALAASVLKLVNSSFYAARERITSLHQAIVRLGLRETRHLIVAVGMKSVFLKLPKKMVDVRDRLWKHSARCAVFSRLLAKRFRLVSGGEDYAAGLSHDFGKILLAIGFPDLFERIYLKAARTAEEERQREHKHLGFDHCQVGVWVGQMWKLPEPVCEVVQHHHTPRQAERYTELTALVSVADLMTSMHDKHACPLDQSDAWQTLCTHFPDAAECGPVELASELAAEACASNKPSQDAAVA
jgi:HD-like signal output (HDOD) protein